MILDKNVMESLWIENVELIFAKERLDFDHATVLGCDILVKIPAVDVEQLRKISFEEGR